MHMAPPGVRKLTALMAVFPLLFPEWHGNMDLTLDL